MAIVASAHASMCVEVLEMAVTTNPDELLTNTVWFRVMVMRTGCVALERAINGAAARLGA